MGSADRRAEAAWVGAWEGCIGHVAGALGLPRPGTSAPAGRHGRPPWTPRKPACGPKLGKPLDPRRWDAHLGGGVVKRQQQHTRAVHSRRQATLHT